MSFKPFNKLNLLAAALGLVALFSPLANLKANRIAGGRAVTLLQTGSPLYLFVAIGILALLLLLSREQRSSWVLVLKFSASYLVIFFPWIIMLLIQRGLIISPTPPLNSAEIISPAAGSWLFLASGYLFLYAAKGSTNLWLKTISWLFPLFLFMLFFVSIKNLSLLKEFTREKNRFFLELTHHLFLSLQAVFLAVLFGLSLGLWAWKKPFFKKPIFAILNSFQTIPSLALFSLLIAPLSFLSRQLPLLRDLGIKGIGWAPALIALTIYALLPVARNSYAGLDSVHYSLREAGLGMGMSKLELFRRVELPLAFPVLFTGIRIALVQTLGLTTVAYLIGAGGLGDFVFRGINQSAPDLILLGVIPIVTLSVVADRSMKLLEAKITPQGLDRHKND